ncbi:hypothetical protein FRB98_008234 [Tulasnella sp. 332]|nr:hypothetical protein FRB98_008234 [Tulasnella sp. 332]
MWARILVVASLVLSVISASLPILQSPGVRRSIASGTFGASLRIVENSGVCETTPGVHTVSGYIDINNNENYFFWFFSSRQTKKASKAPLVLWFNGVLYIDQPIGAGFSHGTQNADSSKSAARKIWVMLQTFFETYPQYEGRELILATESYGGHYGPEFVTYFDAQNKQIRLGRLKGEVITVSALMLNNGWIDPLTQYASYPRFAAHPPGYTPFISDAVFHQATKSMREKDGCGDKVKACNAAGGSNNACHDAFQFCSNFVYGPSLGNRDPYDIRSAFPDPLPPSEYNSYLQQPSVQKAIGAEVKYAECSGPVFDNFVVEGDFTRTQLPHLGALANTKLKILIWYGDADYIANWVGGLALTREMEWYGKHKFGKTPFKGVWISGIGHVGEVINVDNFSFLRVFKAGHEVPFYQPEASLEFLKQVIAKEQIHSV